MVHISQALSDTVHHGFRPFGAQHANQPGYFLVERERI